MTDNIQTKQAETTQAAKKLHTVEGRVVSNRMDKTVTVLVERLVKHALYGKYIRRSTKLHAHDADNTCQMGDMVRIAECAPISKTKNWRVVEVLAHAAE
jgi:small subunit ribosomal protein S17